MKKRRKWENEKKIKRQKNGQTQVFFSFIFYHKRVPPLTLVFHLSTHLFKYAFWLGMHFLAKNLGFKIY